MSRLAQEGVYLSADEFKGKCPVVRGQLCLERAAPAHAGMLFLLMAANSGIAPEQWFCRAARAGWAEQLYQASIARQVIREALVGEP